MRERASKIQLKINTGLIKEKKKKESTKQHTFKAQTPSPEADKLADASRLAWAGFLKGPPGGSRGDQGGSSRQMETAGGT